MLHFSSGIQLFKKSLSSWKEDNVTVWSAALSYYTVFSLAPLLLLVISIAGIFWGDEAVKGQVYGGLAGVVGKSGAAFIQQLLSHTSNQKNNIIATVISVVMLILGATGVFGQLKQALNHIWHVTPKKNIGMWGMFRDRFLSFSLLLAIGFLLVVSLLASTAINLLQTFFSSLLPFPAVIIELINLVFSLGILVILFALIYKILPDVEIEWNDIWVGAGVTAFLFTIGKTLLGIYIGTSSMSSTYGAASSLAVLLLWIYYASQIVFFGAEFTKQYSLTKHKIIAPSKYAVSSTANDISPKRASKQRFFPMIMSQFFVGVMRGVKKNNQRLK